MEPYLKLSAIGQKELKYDVVKLLQEGGRSPAYVDALIEEMGLSKLTTIYPSVTRFIFEIIEVKGEPFVRLLSGETEAGPKFTDHILKVGDQINDLEILKIKPNTTRIEYVDEGAKSALPSSENQLHCP